MRVCIESYGCTANQAEAEIMAGLLVKAGHSIVDEPNRADVIIINSCVVKTPTEDRLIFRLSELTKKFPKTPIIVTGCAPEAITTRLKAVVPGVNLVSTHHVTKIVQAVNAVAAGRIVELVGETRNIKLGLPRIRHNPVTAIVQIASGCIGDCSYCETRLARGPLVSYPKGKILDEIKNAVREGCREIWLTAQDTAMYGLDTAGRPTLPELLMAISKIPGDFYVRVGMANPSSILPIIDDLIKAYNSPRIYKFLHAPVQSGSDEILQVMNRRYKSADFERIVNEFRSAFNCQIWTDVIVGYPGETSKQFRQTVDLLKRTMPDLVNVSKFWPRPNTPAASLEPLPPDIIKQRSEMISRLVTELALKTNKKWVGWTGEILISMPGKKRGQWIGRNFAYKPILINKSGNLLGKKIKAKVLDATATTLIGWPVK
ncbi:MAG: tRNA (N(6)-L-threonylcarbamoyladenosine(37)-C(2))-methylthiotransferase [Candidatus Aenigmarchaeota archaeon]|nr:tRNA (N(6)-L-threonylcarbamoyladenosine(37)-C(2))-methylthiotransferase [Candidatus Aenigmarchaeota archaeon]